MNIFMIYYISDQGMVAKISRIACENFNNLGNWKYVFGVIMSGLILYEVSRILKGYNPFEPYDSLNDSKVKQLMPGLAKLLIKNFESEKPVEVHQEVASQFWEVVKLLYLLGKVQKRGFLLKLLLIISFLISPFLSWPFSLCFAIFSLSCIVVITQGKKRILMIEQEVIPLIEKLTEKIKDNE